MPKRKKPPKPKLELHPRRYEFGTALLTVLNWPEPPNDLGLPEFAGLRPDTDQPCCDPAKASRVLADVRAVTRLLKRIAETFFGKPDAETRPEARVDRLSATLWLLQADRRDVAGAYALERLKLLDPNPLLSPALPAVSVAKQPGGGAILRLGLTASYLPSEIWTAPVIAVQAAREMLRLVSTTGAELGRCPARGPFTPEAVCGRWFIIKPRGQPRAFCSDACQRREKRWRARLRKPQRAKK